VNGLQGIRKRIFETYVHGFLTTMKRTVISKLLAVLEGNIKNTILSGRIDYRKGWSIR